MTRDELQERIEDILDGVVDDAYRDDHESVHEIAKHILALLPPQPKLEWRGDGLNLGGLRVGQLVKSSGGGYGMGWVATTGFVEWPSLLSEADARSSIEDAVRKALRWGQ